MLDMKICVRAMLALAMVVYPASSFAQDSSSTPSPDAAPQQRRLLPSEVEAKQGYRGPFSAVGVAVHVGSLGAGFDVATPIARRLNVRGTADFFSYNLNLTEDGLGYGANLGLHSGQIALDYFPFGGFHISPGVMLAKNNLSAALNAKPGQQISLGDADYYSSTTDPIHGNGNFMFARTASPELKIGFGNIIPRSNRRWSIPFEIGAAYIGHPTMTLALAGTGCQNSNNTNCANLATDPTAQSNIKQEQSDLNEDLKRAAFFPIISIGFGYKF